MLREGLEACYASTSRAGVVCCNARRACAQDAFLAHFGSGKAAGAEARDMLLRAPLPAEQKPWCGFAVAGLAMCWVNKRDACHVGVLFGSGSAMCLQTEHSGGSPVRKNTA